MPTPIPSQAQIQKQLDGMKATGFADLLATAAAANGLPVEFVYGIASRETNCKNILGDVRADGAHGVGIIQIDIQYPIALLARDSGSWKTNPGPLIDFGTKLLAADLIQVKHNRPDLDDEGAMKVAASAYNCGIKRALQGAATSSGDSDIYTTGKDYGAYVMAVTKLFAALLAA